jgi:sRNA-binding regulator protein Hfq
MRVENTDRGTFASFRQESWLPMSSSSSTTNLPSSMPFHRGENGHESGGAQVRNRRSAPAPLSFRFPAQHVDGDSQNRHAELFYLQKQIQSQTPMVIVLEDGERVEGCIEWYDRHALKVRGRTKMLVYKSAIKYMYKLGEAGQ